MKFELTADSTLHFKNEYKGAFLHPKKNDVKIYVTVKDLKLIHADETCKIFSTNTLSGSDLGIIFAGKLNEASLDLNYQSVYYWNNFPCGGKLQLSGSCNELKIWNYALMSVDAQELISQNVFIENSSKGDCSVHAVQGIEYSIFGEGNILLTGQPIIHEKIVTSSGKLIHL